MIGSPGQSSTPAGLRRAFFVSAGLALASLLQAAPPNSAPPPLVQLGRLDPAEARAALDQLRHQGIVGNYYLEFKLRVMPRRGEERRLEGRMWGSRNAQGPLTRVSVFNPGGGDEHRLLIQNGSRAAVWRWSAGGAVELLGVAALFEPVVPDTELTPFDLGMPFIYWDDFTYEGLQRYHGRPAHVFLLRPPAAFAAQHPALHGVRVRLDTQFNALVQTELIGANGGATKTLSLLDLKKIGDQWIPKSFDLRDETSRNKTRLGVTGAALRVEFSPALFEPAGLADTVRPPDAAQLVRIEP